MDDDLKKAQIEAKRQPLEIELFNAELDLKVAKKGKHETITAEAQERADELKDKLAVLADEEKKLR